MAKRSIAFRSCGVVLMERLDQINGLLKTVNLGSPCGRDDSPWSRGCRCTVIGVTDLSQQRGPASNLSPDIVPPVFRNNPAMSGQLLNAQASPYRPQDPAQERRIVAQAHDGMRRSGLKTAQDLKDQLELLDYIKSNPQLNLEEYPAKQDWKGRLFVERGLRVKNDNTLAAGIDAAKAGNVLYLFIGPERVSSADAVMNKIANLVELKKVNGSKRSIKANFVDAHYQSSSKLYMVIDQKVDIDQVVRFIKGEVKQLAQSKSKKIDITEITVNILGEEYMFNPQELEL